MTGQEKCGHGAIFSEPVPQSFEALEVELEVGSTPAVIGERPARRGWDTPSRRREKKATDGVARMLWERDA